MLSSSVNVSFVSKSGGNGIASPSPNSGIVGVLVSFGYIFGVDTHVWQIGACNRFGCARARINAPRISAGIFSCGVSIVGSAVCSVAGAGFSAGSVSDFCFFSIIFFMHFGTHILNKVFWFRATIAVVAIYNGIAANVIMQNVNPEKPCKCACDMRIQFDVLNISKLNKMCIIAQNINIYHNVQIAGILHRLIKFNIIDIVLL